MFNSLLKTASAASVAALGLANAAQAVDLEFYFPVAVGGAAADTIEQLTADYMAANPDVNIEPIYAGSYQDAGQKALTGRTRWQPSANFGSAIHTDVHPDRRRRHRTI